MEKIASAYGILIWEKGLNYAGQERDLRHGIPAFLFGFISKSNLICSSRAPENQASNNLFRVCQNPDEFD